ncbi:hypothetical protein GCM10011390_50460 [Aureimonas endophytica]|uniref:Excisionase family DNA binding protein n=1 Tax=Aureimonas endophytica TaxID=2027858 RepID=A0A917ED74_9HYPH|nr:hypothetical protein GCM10011390_50460 [Aureimonas endophytica]
MAREHPAFRQTDYVRAVKAARAAGLEIYRTEIHPDGRITLRHTPEAISTCLDMGAAGPQTSNYAADVETTRTVEHVEPQSAQAFLKPEDVAKRWECSIRHVRRMMATGELPAMRMGGKIFRVSIKTVEQYEGRQAQPIPPNTLPDALLSPQKPPRAKRLDVRELASLRGPRSRTKPNGYSDRG